VKPESFFNGGVRAEPFFEVIIRCLPVSPIYCCGVDGACNSAEIINI